MYQLKIQKPHEFLNEVAKIYETTPRIFMEYIDNSFDSASDLKKEQEQETGKAEYPYPVKITIVVDPKLKIVKFIDNCIGMNRAQLKGLVTDINKSEKKARPWTNGQFGYGAQAFRACAELMTVISRRKNQPSYKIEISRNEEEIDEETEINSRNFPYNSGTLVILSGFEKQWWDDLSPEVLRREIEKHFEGLLAEENMEVKIVWGQKEERCQPFNYDSIPGKKIKRELVELVIPSRSEKAGSIHPQLNNPIKVYLKVTENIIRDKRPIFINKGRRIGEIQLVGSYIRNKSKYKTAVWGHDNLIGYIETNGNLEPVLVRNDFKRDYNRTGLYDSLVELEEEVWQELVQVNKIIEETSFGKLEDIVSKLVEKLAKEDRLRFKEEYTIGGELNFQEEESGQIKTRIPISLDIPGSGNQGTQIEKGSGVEVIGELSHEESSIKVKRQSGSGFRVRFNPVGPPEEVDPESGNVKKLRSQYVPNDAIHIYVKHEDFQSRVRKTPFGMKLSPRLTSYIASEISIHYKKLFYEKYKLQPQIKAIINDIKRTLSDQAEFIYRLEELLQPYVDKDLSILEVAE